jgi:hypothetical protein
MAAPKQTALNLEPQEVALVVGEEGGEMTIRVQAGSGVPEEAEDLPAAAELVLALAMRLLKDPEFHDEVVDWYYSQDDEGPTP